jgi:hypothetical protein
MKNMEGGGFQMDSQIGSILSSLHSRHIQGIFAETSQVASQKVLDLIPPGAVVGIGDSTAIRQVGIPQALKQRGTRVLDAFQHEGPGINPRGAHKGLNGLMKDATLCDVFLTGTNAITLDGKLVSVDAVGNRVAGMFWGHPTSVVVVGRNKIVKNLDEAFDRIRKVIAPNHSHIRSAELGGGKSRTPCAVTGECNDCRAPDRICNIFVIIEGKPYFTDLSVVIVNEDLGLGWDPAWGQGRINQIVERYKRFVWVPPANDL